MHKLFTCPNCSEVMLKSHGAESKMRNKVLIFREDKAYAVCKGCGVEVQVPLKIDLTNLPNKSSPDLYIDKK